MERKLNIKVLLPEEVIEKYDIDEDTGVLSYKNTKKCLQNPRISAPRKSKQASDSRSPHGERNQAG